MERHQKRGIGSVIIGLMTTLSCLVGSSLVSPYAVLGSLAGIALVAIGVMQFRDSRHVASPESTSASQRIVIFAIAVVSFVVGMAAFWFL